MRSRRDYESARSDIYFFIYLLRKQQQPVLILSLFSDACG